MFDASALWTYGTVFCLLTAAGIGFPIPEELPIVGAGVMVGHASSQEIQPQIPYAASMFAAVPDAPFPGNLPLIALAFETHARAVPMPEPAHWWTKSVPVRWWIMLPVCIIGVVVCDGMLYGSGRLWGPWLLERKFMQRIVPPDRREKIEKNFHDYGVLVLLFARITPTIRAPIFIMAGVIRLPFSKFLLADGLYAIPGVSLLFFLGYWFGEQFIRLIMAFEGKISAARPIVFLLLLAAVAAYLFHHFWRHPWATGDPKQEVPLIGGKVAEIAEKLGHSEAEAARPQTAEPVANNTDHNSSAANLQAAEKEVLPVDDRAAGDQQTAAPSSMPPSAAGNGEANHTPPAQPQPASQDVSESKPSGDAKQEVPLIGGNVAEIAEKHSEAETPKPQTAEPVANNTDHKSSGANLQAAGKEVSPVDDRAAGDHPAAAPSSMPPSAAGNGEANHAAPAHPKPASSQGLSESKPS